MIICPACGTENQEGVISCVKCATLLKSNSPRDVDAGALRNPAPRPDAALQHWLVAEGGSLAGRQFQVTPDGLNVGRHPAQNTIAIDDPEVSRLHARIYLDSDGKAQVEDRSVNGTYVNDRPFDKGALRPNDIIGFGPNPKILFTYRVQHAEALPAASPAQPLPSVAESPRRYARMEAMGSPRVPGTLVARPGDERPVSHHRLQLIIDQYAVKDIPLEPPRMGLGSAGGPRKIVINHPSVSALHAELLLMPGKGAKLRDLNSGSGTFVNGERIEERQVQEGDLIQLGACDTHLLLYREPRRRALVLRDIELNRPIVTLGRDSKNDVHLDHPTVSRFHAEIHRDDGNFELIDKGSTSGTYVNGILIHRHHLQPRDRITIGALQLVFDGSQIEQHSEGTRIRLTASELRSMVRDRQTGRQLALLDGVSLAVEPCEFVGLLGPSGAGKSTLMNALNGFRPADEGHVLFNSLNLYRHFAALRVAIGYVPQEDILHRTLTVRECLYYAARLRLPKDFEETKIWERVFEVIKTMELTDRAELSIQQLSGGQRKRVSLGIELLSKPNLLFMDEPTAGQDPRTEMKMMQLFREIANRGSTVIITTHLLGSFSLLDKVAVLVQGKLAYFGPGQEMLDYFETSHPHELYNCLRDKTAEDWDRRFRESQFYRDFVANPVGDQRPAPTKGPATHALPTVTSAKQSGLRQLNTLLLRQLTLKLKYWTNALGSLLPVAAIALLVGLMIEGPNEPKTLFMIIFAALWFGCSASVREIVDERSIYRRERQRNLTIYNYLGSKFIYLAGLAAVQSGLFIAILTFMGAQENHFLEAWGLMWIMTVHGALIGLMISAISSSPEMALFAFPIALIPQLLLAGLFIPVRTPEPFYPVPIEAERRIEVHPQPDYIPVPKGMGQLLRYGISPLMVARWGLEALTDLYVHDYRNNKAYSYALLGTIAITLHRNDPIDARAHIESLSRQWQGNAPADTSARETIRTAIFPYLGILAGFVTAMLALTAVALKREDVLRR